ncbi:hypothetical protein L218DRAFT_947097 [Marasmius fiardii PR-910]|nr:hypothetical protein L218DRAFT_947097 [Marasmius fiardii PR-910]
MAFEFTPQMTEISNKLWAVTSTVGAGICFLVLVIIAIVWAHPKSRVHLDRVSFRVVVYVVFTNLLFGIASAVGGTRNGPGFLCSFSTFVLQLTLQFSGFLLFCIALNLQLVIVHGMNGKRLEKFYLIGSALLALALVIPPYATHQYGWDPLVQDCWYTNDNRAQRIAWQVGTQVAWTFFTVIGELVCAMVVLIFLLRHNLRFRRAFTPMNLSTTHALYGTAPAPRIIKATRYKWIIFRVALYPVVSCLVNLLSVAAVLHSTISDGIHDATDYDVLLLSMASYCDFLYGGRAIVYGLLAATDPALIRGAKTLVRAVLGRDFDTSAKEPMSTTPSENNGVIVHIELSSFQVPPPLPDDRDPKKEPTQDPNASKEEDGVPILDTYGHSRPNRLEQLETFASPLPSRIDGPRRRRVEREMSDEDSFEKAL